MQCEKYGDLRILIGKRTYYEGVLNPIKSPLLAKCKDYLDRAEGKNKGLDQELKQKEISKSIKL